MHFRTDVFVHVALYFHVMLYKIKLHILYQLTRGSYSARIPAQLWNIDIKKRGKMQTILAVNKINIPYT